MPAESPRDVAVPPCGCERPGAAAAAACYCAVEDLLRILRRRYSIAVLNAVRSHEPARYQAIAAALPRMSSSTLAETLDVLASANLISREGASLEHGQPVYRLTLAGDKLLSRLKPLLEDIQQS